MTSISIRSSDDLKMDWPHVDDKIIKLAQAFLSYEASLPDAERMNAASTAVMQSLLTEAESMAAEVSRHKFERGVAATDYSQQLEMARDKLEQIIQQLKTRYWNNLSWLEGWGLRTKTNRWDKITVRQPRSDLAWDAFLNAYVTRESSLPEAERISNPSLAEMTALRDTVAASYAAREASTQARKESVERRNQVVERLNQLLRACAAILITTHFDGRLTRQLGRWGFTLVERQPSATADPVDESSTADPVDEPPLVNQR